MSDYFKIAGRHLKIGDLLNAEDILELPTGAVVIIDNGPNDHNVLVKRDNNIAWITALQAGDRVASYPDVVGVNGWRLVHMPTEKHAEVGDVITTREEADRLPVGSAAVCLCETHAPNQRVTVKHSPEEWSCFFGGGNDTVGIRFGSGKPFRVIHVPDADADTGGAAA